MIRRPPRSTLFSLHDALPICQERIPPYLRRFSARERGPGGARRAVYHGHHRSEEHTSELQSLAYLVCRLLLEKKKKDRHIHSRPTRLGPRTHLHPRYVSVSRA